MNSDGLVARDSIAIQFRGGVERKAIEVAGKGRVGGKSGEMRSTVVEGRGRMGGGAADNRKMTVGRIARGEEGFWEWVGLDGAWGRSCTE